jgi:hypothetical protein
MNTSNQTEEPFSDPIMKRRLFRAPSRDIISLLMETGITFGESSQLQTNETLAKDKTDNNTNLQTANNEQNDNKSTPLSTETTSLGTIEKTHQRRITIGGELRGERKQILGSARTHSRKFSSDDSIDPEIDTLIQKPEKTKRTITLKRWLTLSAEISKNLLDKEELKEKSEEV